jgi:hypothetical protein
LPAGPTLHGYLPHLIDKRHACRRWRHDNRPARFRLPQAGVAVEPGYVCVNRGLRAPGLQAGGETCAAIQVLLPSCLNNAGAFIPMAVELVVAAEGRSASR